MSCDDGPASASPRHRRGLPATRPFVDFNRVWLAYDDDLARRGEFAVEDISLQADEGEFIAIVGPSGCGKSTFMKLATGLRQATRGAVSINGEKVSGPLKQVAWLSRRRRCCHGAPRSTT
jgi:ABC-type nitrate/sulfonate/bicarbonate transport system ATPase subunit